MYRPTSAQVCKHPFFWDAQKRLDFLVNLSDRLEQVHIYVYTYLYLHICIYICIYIYYIYIYIYIYVYINVYIYIYIYIIVSDLFTVIYLSKHHHYYC
jgi:hypothetical protein